MATTSTPEKGIGLTILFVVIAVLGALTMGVGAEDNLIAAAGFAVAVTGGTLAIAARHLYP